MTGMLALVAASISIGTLRLVARSANLLQRTQGVLNQLESVSRVRCNYSALEIACAD